MFFSLSICSQLWPSCSNEWEVWVLCVHERAGSRFKAGLKVREGREPWRKESRTMKEKKGMKSLIASQGCILKCHLIGFQARKVSGPVGFQ